MARTALIEIEGVLAQRSERLVEAQLMPGGLRLYTALLSQYKPALSTLEEPEPAQHWLKVNGVKDWGAVWTAAYLYPEENDLRGYHRGLARLEGVDIYVTASPLRAAQGLFEGIPTLLASNPVFGRPEWRPDAPRDVREWDEIATELDRQALLASQNEES